MYTFMGDYQGSRTRPNSNMIKRFIDFVCPLMYVLLPGKHAETYGAMYRQIKVVAAQQNIAIGWTRVWCFASITNDDNIFQCVTDFEGGPLKTFGNEFPNCEHVTCYFHFTQDCLKWIQKQGFRPVYDDRNDDSFRVMNWTAKHYMWLVISIRWMYVQLWRLDSCLSPKFAWYSTRWSLFWRMKRLIYDVFCATFRNSGLS